MERTLVSLNRISNTPFLFRLHFYTLRLIWYNNIFSSLESDRRKKKVNAKSSSNQVQHPTEPTPPRIFLRLQPQNPRINPDTIEQMQPSTVGRAGVPGQLTELTRPLTRASSCNRPTAPWIFISHRVKRSWETWETREICWKVSIGSI
jgi:hypothetical protein